MTDFESQEEVLNLIAESWAKINKGKDEINDRGAASKHTDVDGCLKNQDLETIETVKKEKAHQPREKKRHGFFACFAKKQHNVDGGVSEDKESSDGGKNTIGTVATTIDMPDTFAEMVKLNAAMIGANVTYINIVIDEFATFVRDVCEFRELQEQTDILAMRISKNVKGAVRTSEFKVCMLASMRSFLPANWDTRHERAWLWLWDGIDAKLKESLRQPPKYAEPVQGWVNGLEREERRAISAAIWTRMFQKDTEAERVFKQSNESNDRLIFIVEKALEYSAKIFQEPSQTREYFQGLGMRHFMLDVNPKSFADFVDCMQEELKERDVDETVINGIHWSLSVIASIMARTVEQESQFFRGRFCQ